MDLQDGGLQHWRVFLENKIRFKPQVVVMSGHSPGYLSFRKWRSSNDAFHLVDGNYTGQYTSVQLRRLGCGNWGREVVGRRLSRNRITLWEYRNPKSLSLILSLSCKQLNFAVLAISLAILQDIWATSFTRPFDFYDAALGRQNRGAEFSEVG